VVSVNSLRYVGHGEVVMMGSSAGAVGLNIGKDMKYVCSEHVFMCFESDTDY